MAKQEAKNWVGTFESHGIEIRGRSGDTHVMGDCPFCEKEKHFAIRRENGQWKCHRCGEEGNVYTFLTKMAERYVEDMTPSLLRRLANFRGLPTEAFDDTEIGWNGEAYTLPQRNVKGTVVNIVTWQGPGHKMYSTRNCSKTLVGTRELAASPKEPVWLSGGEWDRIALRWLLRQLKRKDVVLGVPGETSWKPEWTKLLEGRDVRIAYDADEAGDKGSAKAGAALQSSSRSVKYLCWQEDTPKGFDLNDWVTHAWQEHRKDLSGSLRALELLLQKKHRKGGLVGMGVKTEDEEEAEKSQRPTELPQWSQVLEIFRRHVVSSRELEMALTLSAAVVLSCQYHKNPPWLFIVGPPGGGKTTVIQSVFKSNKTLEISSLTPKSLISGWNRDSNDPSLLPKLRGKCGVFKDATEILKGDFRDMNELFGILRGAFDGSVSRSYGNGETRHYTNLWFTMLLGVTPAIEKASQADLGERFIRFRLSAPNEKAAMKHLTAAMTGGAVADEEELQRAMADFLWNELPAEEDLPQFTRQGTLQIEAMAQVVARLRFIPAFVRNFGDQGGERLEHDLYHESPTRVFAQIYRLTRVVAWILGADFADAALDYARKLAEDSCSWAYVSIVAGLSRVGHTRDAKDLAKEIGKHTNTIRHYCDVLRTTGFLLYNEFPTGGRKGKGYFLKPEFHDLVMLSGMWKEQR